MFLQGHESVPVLKKGESYGKSRFISQWNVEWIFYL